MNGDIDVVLLAVFSHPSIAVWKLVIHVPNTLYIVKIVELYCEIAPVLVDYVKTI